MTTRLLTKEATLLECPMNHLIATTLITPLMNPLLCAKVLFPQAATHLSPFHQILALEKTFKDCHLKVLTQGILIQETPMQEILMHGTPMHETPIHANLIQEIPMHATLGLTVTLEWTLT